MANQIDESWKQLVEVSAELRELKGAFCKAEKGEERALGFAKYRASKAIADAGSDFLKANGFTVTGKKRAKCKQ